MANIFPSERHRAVLLTTLKTYGVTKITVEFSGGGDSGAIDGVTFRTAGGHIKAEDLPPIVWPRKSSGFDTESGEWQRITKDETMPLKDVVEAVTYEALEHTDQDWYNNNGGQGEFEIDLTTTPPTILIDLHINVTMTEDYTFDFSGKQMVETYRGRTD